MSRQPGNGKAMGALEGRWCSGTRESSEGLAGSLHSCECGYGGTAAILRRFRARIQSLTRVTLW